MIHFVRLSFRFLIIERLLLGGNGHSFSDCYETILSPSACFDFRQNRTLISLAQFYPTGADVRQDGRKKLGSCGLYSLKNRAYITWPPPLIIATSMLNPSITTCSDNPKPQFELAAPSHTRPLEMRFFTR